MKKYIQPIMFSINEEFHIRETFIGRMAKDVVISKWLEPYVKDDKLVIKDAVGECLWNSKSPTKYYFIGGTNITSLVKSGGIDISMTDKIKVEDC